MDDDHPEGCNAQESQGSVTCPLGCCYLPMKFCDPGLGGWPTCIHLSGTPADIIRPFAGLLHPSQHRVILTICTERAAGIPMLLPESFLFCQGFIPSLGP